jgi:acetone carboxylase gamma subunit
VSSLKEFYSDTFLSPRYTQDCITNLFAGQASWEKRFRELSEFKKKVCLLYYPLTLISIISSFDNQFFISLFYIH